MIAESLTTYALHLTFLALTPSERWNAAKSPLESSFNLEQWFIPLLVVAQIVSLVVVFGLMAKRRHLERKYEQQVSRLSATNERLTLQVEALTPRVETEASYAEKTLEEPVTV
jgi:hypothetical protein